MTTATVDVAPIQLGRVVNGAVAAVGRSPVAYLALAAIFVAAPTILINLIVAEVTRTSMPSPSQIDEFRVAYLQGAIEGLFAYPFIGGVTVGVLAYLDGKRLSFQECLSRGLQLWLPLVALNLVTGLLGILALIALIVPALVLSVFWIVAVPVMVAEKRTIGKTLSRSQALTKGRRGSIIVFMLIMVAIVIGLVIVLAMLHAAVSAIVGVTGAPLQPAVQAVFAAISQGVMQLTIAAGLASLYHELRVTRDGESSASVAETFS